MTARLSGDVYHQLWDGERRHGGTLAYPAVRQAFLAHYALTPEASAVLLSQVHAGRHVEFSIAHPDQDYAARVFRRYP
jgi:hypothetical protein